MSCGRECCGVGEVSVADGSSMPLVSVVIDSQGSFGVQGETIPFVLVSGREESCSGGIELVL